MAFSCPATAGGLPASGNGAGSSASAPLAETKSISMPLARWVSQPAAARKWAGRASVAAVDGKEKPPMVRVSGARARRDGADYESGLDCVGYAGAEGGEALCVLKR